MIAFFANLFGYVLNFLYELVGSFGFAIILFSLLIKLVMLPISIKQQKTMKKSQKINDEMKQIQFKYKNDPEKLNQEVMSLYKRENMSPFSGCFSAIAQIILLFAVFYLVRSPLTYMRKIDSGVIEKLGTVVEQNGSASNYKEIAIINYINNIKNASNVMENGEDEQSDKQENDEQTIEDENVVESTENNQENSSESRETEDKSENNEDNSKNKESNENESDNFKVEDHIDKLYLNMDFMGIDLSKVPTEDLGDFKTLIIPILYVVSSFISIKLSTNTTKKNKNLIGDGKKDENNQDEYDPMEEANKRMTLFMPIMSISIALIAPLGLALYWLVNNILMMLERIILNKIIKDNEEEAIRNA